MNPIKLLYTGLSGCAIYANLYIVLYSIIDVINNEKLVQLKEFPLTDFFFKKKINQKLLLSSIKYF